MRVMELTFPISSLFLSLLEEMNLNFINESDRKRRMHYFLDQLLESTIPSLSKRLFKVMFIPSGCILKAFQYFYHLEMVNKLHYFDLVLIWPHCIWLCLHVFCSVISLHFSIASGFFTYANRTLVCKLTSFGQTS